ncbi:MAG TPA: Nif3-like dinuclear metal center hexameric protein [Aggregatilineales bacterium]|nr:Nif3-like dinuclear metal center hexameric protein [Aggregatilineales bacterium]
MTITIQEAINAIISAVPSAPFQQTVDSIKLGDPSQPVRGIVTTFLASYEVIQKAVQLDANLIIAHEPLFYNHLDKTDWLKEDAVYQAKRQLVETSGLVVWRFHDYMHSMRPDPVFMGILQALGWQDYAKFPDLTCQIPPVTLRELVDTVKAKLGIQTLRFIGDPDMECKTVALMPGFPPVEYQVGLLNQPGVDVIICGEIHEWETSEYTRDAIRVGQKKALIVSGHAASEEAGMRAMVPWLQERLPNVPIQFVPTATPFQYL